MVRKDFYDNRAWDNGKVNGCVSSSGSRPAFTLPSITKLNPNTNVIIGQEEFIAGAGKTPNLSLLSDGYMRLEYIESAGT